MTFPRIPAVNEPASALSPKARPASGIEFKVRSVLKKIARLIME